MFRAEYDDTELRHLQVDLHNAPRRVQRGATDVLWDSAGLVQRSFRRIVGGHRYLPHLPKTVSREMLTPFVAEIGMETSRKQGRLAHIMAYGSANNDPVFDHNQALVERTDQIVKKFADMGEEAMLGDEQ